MIATRFLCGLDFLAMVGHEPHKHSRWRPNLTDESDNKFVECAIASGSRFVVTKNTRDFRNPDLEHMGFEVLSPQQSIGRHGTE